MGKGYVWAVGEERGGMQLKRSLLRSFKDQTLTANEVFLFNLAPMHKGTIFASATTTTANTSQPVSGGRIREHVVAFCHESGLQTALDSRIK